jgi:Putative auto-transporter adhesin, head GIN domain
MSIAPTPFHTRRAPHRYQAALAAALVLVLVAIIVLLVFKGSGSGVAATQTRSLAPFTGIELAGSNDVTVQVGRTQSVIVHADKDLLGRVTTEVKSGQLVIGNTGRGFRSKTPMSVAVRVPSLAVFTLSGSGVVSLTGINARAFTVSIPGTGSGVVRASGTVDRLDITVGGSGAAQLTQLVARDVRAVVSGSGAIMLTATGSLNAAVTGDGAILYSGNPAHVTTTVTGTGAITPG